MPLFADFATLLLAHDDSIYRPGKKAKNINCCNVLMELFSKSICTFKPPETYCDLSGKNRDVIKEDHTNDHQSVPG